MGPRIMAEWGKGDGRWIVEDRADGANVNNWHWTEKDVTKIAEQRLKEKCCECEFEQRPIRFKDVKKFTDEEGTVTSSTAGVIKMDEIIDDEPETEFQINKKKSKGDAIVPDAKEKSLLCESAVNLINELLSDFKEGRVDVSVPQKPVQVGSPAAAACAE